MHFELFCDVASFTAFGERTVRVLSGCGELCCTFGPWIPSPGGPDGPEGPGLPVRPYRITGLVLCSLCPRVELQTGLGIDLTGLMILLELPVDLLLVALVTPAVP